jgi:hypothetical protein
MFRSLTDSSRRFLAWATRTEPETPETYDMIIIAFKHVGTDFGVLSDLQDVLVEMWCR